jgi:receptor protein-tyrosine kinase
MSKIFDALQGTQSEVSDLLPALIDSKIEDAGRSMPTPGPEPPAKGVSSPAAAPQNSAVEYSAAHTSSASRSIRRIPLAVAESAPLLPFENPREHAAEQYRILRTKIAHHPKKPKMIVVSSSGRGDGKSLTAINLCGVLSLKRDTNVLLLDADFRRSTLHSLLGLPQVPGLAEVVAGKCSFEDAVVQADQYPNLHILVSGDVGDLNPSELLDSVSWQALCQVLRTRYTYIIIDSPPVAAVADFDLIQMAAEATVLVVRPDHSKRTACFKAIELVPKEKFLGVILNCAENWVFQRDDTYGYDYGKAEGALSNGASGPGPEEVASR